MQAGFTMAHSGLSVSILKMLLLSRGTHDMIFLYIAEVGTCAVRCGICARPPRQALAPADGSLVWP
jgi:hypothetical protein